MRSFSSDSYQARCSQSVPASLRFTMWNAPAPFLNKRLSICPKPQMPGDPQGALLQADLLLNLGYAHLRGYDFVAAGRAFEDAQRIGRPSGNMRALMLSSRYLASSYVMWGLLNEATMVYRQTLRWATAGGQKPPPAAGTIYIGNALLLYERNDVDAALEQAQQGLALGLRK
jgi:hypothetical protein